jgi:hypothetical protein
MKKAEDYRAHAAECRQLARASRDSKTRDMLLNMAKTWESLAVDREIELARQARIRTLEVGLSSDKS